MKKGEMKLALFWIIIVAGFAFAFFIPPKRYVIITNGESFRVQERRGLIYRFDYSTTPTLEEARKRLQWHLDYTRKQNLKWEAVEP